MKTLVSAKEAREISKEGKQDDVLTQSPEVFKLIRTYASLGFCNLYVRIHSNSYTNIEKLLVTKGYSVENYTETNNILSEKSIKIEISW